MSEKPDQKHQTTDVRLKRTPRRRWLSVLLSIMLLLCGGVIGSGLTVVVIVQKAQYRLGHPEEYPARATSRLRRRLDLTDEQAQKVEAIFRQRQEALQKFRERLRPKLEENLERLREDIGEVLTEDQRERWETWLEEQRNKWLPLLQGQVRHKNHTPLHHKPM